MRPVRGAPVRRCVVRVHRAFLFDVSGNFDRVGSIGTFSQTLEEKRTVHTHGAPRMAHRARSALYLILKTTIP